MEVVVCCWADSEFLGQISLTVPVRFACRRAAILFEESVRRDMSGSRLASTNISPCRLVRLVLLVTSQLTGEEN